MKDFSSFINNTYSIKLPKNLMLLEDEEKVSIMTKEAFDYKEKNERKGMIAGRKLEMGYKPSTDFLQMFGNLAKKNFVVLNENESLGFAKGENISLDEKRIEKLEKWFLIVKNGEGAVLGCGYLRGNTLENNIPKYRRIFAGKRKEEIEE
jgi:NOL1/NOP2/fmu family ribosome biogenesis protein